MNIVATWKHSTISCIQVDMFEPTPDAHLRAVALRDVHTGATSALPADAAFVAIGHDPNTAMLRGQVAAGRWR